MKVEAQGIFIETKRGYRIAAQKFSSKKEIQKTLVISSATGVLQKFYSKFASFFAEQGFVVYTFDYRGIGTSGSSIYELKNTAVTLTDWAQNDQAAVVAFAKKAHPNAALILVTHSLGGQLVGLNPNYHMLDKVILVGSQSGYWRYFPGFQKLKMWAFWYLAIPVMTTIFGYFPAKKLGLFENLPKNMVYEWAKWGRQSAYMMPFKDDPSNYFSAIDVPILSLSFPNDPFAPKKTVDWLSDQYENAKLTRVHYQPENNEKQPGHFGFFKPAFEESLWKKSLKWILNDTFK